MTKNINHFNNTTYTLKSADVYTTLHLQCSDNVAKYQDIVEKKIEKNPNKKTVEIVILQNKISETYFNDMTTVDLHESPKSYCHDFSSTETS